TIHEQGLVSILKQLHDELDAAVAEAYGWPVDLADEALLEKLVDLNRQRAREEEQGLVRWLRPDYQNPAGSRDAAQQALPEAEDDDAPAAVRAALSRQSAPVSAKELKEQFKNAREPKVREILAALAALASIGQAREMEDGRYVS
ncbi:MAG: hypothetical protein RBT64_15120, partial [Trichloromonas sp.]|nr:hypothetical protein [Trichloromonas sp.]